ncbi:hypothetical protein M408DRAFT_329296 [Serendipita vermifera MAFF 305830]|uniref:Uncharacterized protein n=1 Tax=Serendipita vermifera MAFF 305830 TaxID=933852 RepID=A0A0C2WRS8_SERVB|nr:hypothetical protein M408DRAFT_329296 [Serendipita vermifera MAFF 305830]
MEEIEPPRKRLKPSKSIVEEQKVSNKQLFAPFRALGFITNHVPFAMQVRSFKGATGAPRVHIVTCLGNSWAEFEGEKMKLLFVGPDAKHPITSVVLDGDHVLVTAGPDIIRYTAGKETSRLSSPFASSLSSVLVFGSQLLALTDDGRHLLVWDANSEELQSTIIFETNFTATKVIHPATLLNKVLVSSAQGTLQLWNIRTVTCIHTFSPERLLPEGTKEAPISVIVQSHVADIIGVGFSSGIVIVHDIRADERILHVKMDGAITAVAFRTDGQEVLATSNTAGHVALWDLNQNGRLLHIIRGAHDGSVASIQWIPNQPVLVTSGEDNSIKQWIFDSPDVPPRLLKFRSGHHAPPHLIRYYGEDGKQLLTAASDRSLRCTSIVRDSRSFELSQGSISKKATSSSIPLASLKFPSVTALSFSDARSKDWDDVLTGHENESVARTWSVPNKRLGKHTFSTAPDGTKEATGSLRGAVKAVHVTACGNFGIAASSTGTIQLWNMQSGFKRKTFILGPAPEEAGGRFGTKPGKSRCVTALATDALNTCLVAGTLDGTLNFFNFHTKALEEVLVLPSSVTSMTLQRESNILAVICDDLCVRLFDLETKRLVRELTGFKGRVLDLTFSHDSRWLITTSLDSIIRTFDIPTGQVIDAFRTSSVATSLSFSPTGDFLASAHVGSLGIYLWANRAQYAEVSWRTASEIEMAASEGVDLPLMQGTSEQEALEGLTGLGVIESPDVFRIVPQLDGDLITLTLLPRARWQTLLNLDVISQRNKPKEPLKAPEKAPFFIPSLPGESLRFNVEKPTEDSSAGKASSRLEKSRAMEAESDFQRLLQNEEDADSNSAVFTLLKSLSPPAVELELRLLLSLRLQSRFIHALIQRLRSHLDFEMVQTLMAVFLRLHGESMVENIEMRQELEELLQLLKSENSRLRSLVMKNLGMLGFIREVG